MRTTHGVLDRFQQGAVNPVVKLGWKLGIPIPGDALLETTGRRVRIGGPEPRTSSTATTRASACEPWAGPTLLAGSACAPPRR